MEITHKIRTSFKTLASKKATATWQLKKSLSNNKLLWKVMPSRWSMEWKHTHWKKGFLLLLLLKVCGLLLFRKSKKTFGILWSVWVFFAFLGIKGLNKYCLLVVFSSISVANTKIIFVYNFVAPLKWHNTIVKKSYLNVTACNVDFNLVIKLDNSFCDWLHYRYRPTSTHRLFLIFNSIVRHYIEKHFC